MSCSAAGGGMTIAVTDVGTLQKVAGSELVRFCPRSGIVTKKRAWERETPS